MPRGGRRVGAGRPKGAVTRKPGKPTLTFLKQLRAADSHAAVRMLGERLAEEGQFEAAARTIAKIVRYETSPMPPSAREAPLSARQLDLFERRPIVAPLPKPEGDPDEFVGLLN